MKTLTAYDILNIDGTLYYVCNEFNALVKCENMKQHELIGCLPEESIYEKALVSQIIYEDKRMIFIPLNAKKIWIFDLNKKNWKDIEIENSGCNYKFMKAVKYENRIYLFPSRYRKMVIFDLTTDTIKYMDIGDKEGATFFRNDIVIKGSIVYAAYCSGGYVFKFDMSNEKYEWIKIDKVCDGFSGIAYDQNKFWLSVRNDSDKLYCWDGNDYCKKFSIKDKEIGLSKGIFYRDGKIYIKKEEETLILEVQNPHEINKHTMPYLFFNVFQGEYNALTVDSDYTWQDKEETKAVKLQIGESDRATFIEDRITNCDVVHFQDMGMIFENKDFDISDFLKLVSKKGNY